MSIEVRECALTRRVRIAAPFVEQALEMRGDGLPGRRVRLLLPVDPEAFFVSEDSRPKEAA